MRGEAVEQGVTALWSEAERTPVVSGDRESRREHRAREGETGVSRA